MFLVYLLVEHLVRDKLEELLLLMALDEVHGFDLGESKELKEDVELEDVLELLLPDSNEGVTTEEPVEPVVLIFFKFRNNICW